MNDDRRKAKCFQEATVVKKCFIPIDSYEVQCIGYKWGSHGDCDFRGTGSAYEECHNPIVLKGVILI